MVLELDNVITEVDKELKLLELRKRINVSILNELLNSDFKLKVSVYSQNGSEELFIIDLHEKIKK